MSTVDADDADQGDGNGILCGWVMVKGGEECQWMEGYGKETLATKTSAMEGRNNREIVKVCR